MMRFESVSWGHVPTIFAVKGSENTQKTLYVIGAERG